MVRLDWPGKRLGCRAVDLLGGAYREEVPVDYWCGRQNPDDLRKTVERARALGFSGLKMKSRFGDPVSAQIRAIRETAGDGFSVTIDPMYQWFSPNESLSTLKALEEFAPGVRVEDPFPEDRPEFWHRARQVTTVPLVWHARGLGSLRRALQERCADAYNCSGCAMEFLTSAHAVEAAGHEVLIVCQSGSGLERCAAAESLPVAPVAMPHDVSLPAIAGIAGVLRRFRPAVMLFCNERAFRLGMPAAWIAGRPALVYRNGLTATFKNRSINRVLFRSAARMVVISQPLREEMAGYGWIPPERIQVIRNGIDTSLYEPDAAARRRVRSELGASGDAVVAAVLARITSDKGQVETIRAFASLTRRHPRSELWIVGEGSLQPRLEGLAREIGVGERVRFPGFRSDVPAVLQAVDIVVQASHREGLGNTLLEAMSARRPIVASAVGGILDVVVPGVTGDLVPPFDPDALAGALEPLLADEGLRQRYGEAGRRRVEEEFRLDRETDAWCRLFEEIA